MTEAEEMFNAHIEQLKDELIEARCSLALIRRDVESIKQILSKMPSDIAGRDELFVLTDRIRHET